MTSQSGQFRVRSDDLDTFVSTCYPQMTDLRMFLLIQRQWQQMESVYQALLSCLTARQVQLQRKESHASLDHSDFD